VLHGLFGPQIAPRNLATVLTWVHYRGLPVVALLAAGNLFCTGCPFILVRDAAGKHDANWLGAFSRISIERRQPFRDLVSERAEVAAADLVEIGRKHRAWRVEETRVRRIRIGASNQAQLEDVVSRDHPRVARMELFSESFRGKRAMQRIDAIGNEQCRPFLALGQKVTHRPIERPRQPHGDAIPGHECERTVDGAHGGRISGPHVSPRLVDGEVVNAIERRIQQIDDALHVLPHSSILDQPSSRATYLPRVAGHTFQNPVSIMRLH
jgi:hypothetical protein